MKERTKAETGELICVWIVFHIKVAPRAQQFYPHFRQLTHPISYIEHLDILARIVKINRLDCSESCPVYLSRLKASFAIVTDMRKTDLARITTDCTIDKGK